MRPRLGFLLLKQLSGAVAWKSLVLVVAATKGPAGAHDFLVCKSNTLSLQIDNIIVLTDCWLDCAMVWAINNYKKEANSKALTAYLLFSDKWFYFYFLNKINFSHSNGTITVIVLCFLYQLLTCISLFSHISIEEEAPDRNCVVLKGFSEQTLR